MVLGRDVVSVRGGEDDEFSDFVRGHVPVYKCCNFLLVLRSFVFCFCSV